MYSLLKGKLIEQWTSTLLGGPKGEMERKLEEEIRDQRCEPPEQETKEEGEQQEEQQEEEEQEEQQEQQEQEEQD